MATDEQLMRQLGPLRNSVTVIIGIGNTLKADDGAGPLVCQRLKGKISAELINAGSVPENYIEPIVKKAPQNLIVVDAADFKARPGTIRILQIEDLKSSAISTHALSPQLFTDVISQQIPVKIHFIGIQPQQVGFGKGVSAPVSRAIQQLSGILKRVFPRAQ